MPEVDGQRCVVAPLLCAPSGPQSSTEIYGSQYDNTSASILIFTHMFINIIPTTVIVLTDICLMFYFLKTISILTPRESQNRMNVTNQFCMFSLTLCMQYTLSIQIVYLGGLKEKIANQRCIIFLFLSVNPF